MKLKKYISIILCAILLCAALAACGSSSKNAAYESASAADAPAAMAEQEFVEMDYAAANGAALSDSGITGSTALPESRKWIITVDMSAETDDLDALTAALDESIRAMNGYVEDQNVYNGSAYSGHRYRSASLTIRIPAEAVDRFTEAVSGIANVVRKNKSLEDVTLNYVATESRVTALETEEARLLELLAKAETMSDLLEIEGRLTDVRYELENHASQLRLYDNQIDYATIYLNIEEVQEYTPVEEPTLGERIRDGFTGSLKGLGESLQNLLVTFIASLPFLLVYGGIALAIVLLIRKLRKNRKAKKNQKQPPASPDSQA